MASGNTAAASPRPTGGRAARRARFDIPLRPPPRPLHGVLAAAFVATVALSAIIGAERGRLDGPSVPSQQQSSNANLS